MSIDDLVDVSSPSTTPSSTLLQHSNSLCDLDLETLDDDEWLFSPMKLTQTQKSIRPLTWLTQAEDSSDEEEDDTDSINTSVRLRKKKTHNLSPYIPYTETSAGDFAPWRRRGSAHSLAGSTNSTISTSSSVYPTMIRGDVSKESRDTFATDLQGYLNGKFDPTDKTTPFDIQSAIHFFNNLSVRDDGKSELCDGIRGETENRPVELDSTSLDDLWNHTSMPSPVKNETGFSTTAISEHQSANQSATPMQPSATPEARSPTLSRPCSASSTTSGSSSRTQVSTNDSPKKPLSPRPRSSLPIPNSWSPTIRKPFSSSNHSSPTTTPCEILTPRTGKPTHLENRQNSSPTTTPREILTPRTGKSTHLENLQYDNSKLRSPVAPRSSLLGRYTTPPSMRSEIKRPSPTTPTLSKSKQVRSSPNLTPPSTNVSERRNIPSSTIDRSKIADPVHPKTSVPGVRRFSLQRPVGTENSKLPVPRSNPGKSGLPRPASFAGSRNLQEMGK